MEYYEFIKFFTTSLIEDVFIQQKTGKFGRIEIGTS
jgi:hypothetical protein